MFYDPMKVAYFWRGPVILLTALALFTFGGAQTLPGATNDPKSAVVANLPSANYTATRGVIVAGTVDTTSFSRVVPRTLGPGVTAVEVFDFA